MSPLFDFATVRLGGWGYRTAVMGGKPVCLVCLRSWGRSKGGVGFCNACDMTVHLKCGRAHVAKAEWTCLECLEEEG